MLFNVPQYIGVEDKVAGPFTAKQLLWMFGMGAVLLILWGVLERAAFFITAIPVMGLFCALAFYKPHGQPLIKFVVWGIYFLFQPKVYVWKREMVKKSAKEKSPIKKEDKVEEKVEKKKDILAKNIEAFAQTLDSEGKERNDKMMEIIKKNREKNKK